MSADVTDAPVLSRRALNRATLDRQLLLRRSPLSAAEAIEHLGGLQAQTPHTWYVGLWTRLVDVSAEQVSDLLRDRRLVRMALMRSTIHLVTADDALALRHLFDLVVERNMRGAFGRNLKGIDEPALLQAGRELVEEQPLTFSELGRRLAERWPDRDPASLAQAIRGLGALVQVPPRGLWRTSGKAAHTTAEHWLGRPLRTDVTVDDLVLRYLTAFGPATVKDVQNWSGLTRLNEVVKRLDDRLVTFRDEQDRVLYDLPDAPRPDPDVPAPPRFLYDFDNLLLSHADRSRFITDEYFRQGYTDDGAMPRMILLDGFTNGSWTTARARRHVTLTIQPFRRCSPAEQAALTEEGLALLAFSEPDATTSDVEFLPPRP